MKYLLILLMLPSVSFAQTYKMTRIKMYSDGKMYRSATNTDIRITNDSIFVENAKRFGYRLDSVSNHKYSKVGYASSKNKQYVFNILFNKIEITVKEQNQLTRIMYSLN